MEPMSNGGVLCVVLALLVFFYLWDWSWGSDENVDEYERQLNRAYYSDGRGVPDDDRW